MTTRCPPCALFAIVLIATLSYFSGANGVFVSNVRAQPVPVASAASVQLQGFSSAPEGEPPPPWRVAGLPGSGKPLTQFDVVQLGAERVLRVRADHSYANLSHRLPANTPIGHLHWRWRLDQPVDGANLRTRNGDDIPIKVCALFDLPLEKLGVVERNLLRVARRASGEHLPGATVCYVWDQKLAVGTELPSPFTQRLSYVVVDSGSTGLRHWSSHTRDLRADFLRSFGAVTDVVPPLLAIVVGADADNTASTSLAYVGDVQLLPP